MAQDVCSPAAIGHAKVVADFAKCLTNRGHICCSGPDACIRRRCEPQGSNTSAPEADTPATESTSVTTTLTTTPTTTAGSGVGSTMVPTSGNFGPDDDDFPPTTAIGVDVLPDEDGPDSDRDDEDEEDAMMPVVVVAGYGFGFAACLKRGTHLPDVSKSSLCCSGVVDFRTLRCLRSNRCVAAAVGHQKVIGDRDRCLPRSGQLCCGGTANCVNRRCVPAHVLNMSAGWVPRNGSNQAPKVTSPDSDPSQPTEAVGMPVIGIGGGLVAVLLGAACVVQQYRLYKGKLRRKAARHVARLAHDKTRTRSAGAAATVEAMTAAVAEDASLGGQPVGSDAVSARKKRWVPHINLASPLQETGGAGSTEGRGRGRSKLRSANPGGSPGATSDLVAKTSEAGNDYIELDEWENDGGAWDTYCNRVMEAKAQEALLAKTRVITDC